MADGWLRYLARCQHLLRQGLFVADFAFLQSEAVPGFIPPRSSQRPAGFDYDAMNAYRTTFELKKQDSDSAVYLDLGLVKNVARVRLNGRDLGVVWTAPWHVEIGEALKPGANQLEIEVANLWPNRLIGDTTLPAEQRRTATNVRTYDTIAVGGYGCRKCAERKQSNRPAELFPSGLLGPVRLMTAE